jgi:hypothetical protein
MATANIVKIGSGSLNAGASTTKGWNNPPLGKVLGFWVQPQPLASGEILVGEASFQITGVTTTMNSPDHFVAQVTVKNTGTAGHGFDLFMSFLG